MVQRRLSEREFLGYGVADEEALEGLLFDLTAEEVREVIAGLIEERERLKEEQLRRLEEESARLLRRLRGVNRRKLVAELECFKEVLSLQRRLLRENGAD